MTWYEKHTCKINSIFIPIQIEMCVSVYEEVAFITQSHSSTLFLCARRMHHKIELCGSVYEEVTFRTQPHSSTLFLCARRMHHKIELCGPIPYAF